MDSQNANENKSHIKPLLWPLGLLLMVFLVLLIAQKGFELNRTVKNDKPQNTISISAEGKVKAVPDIAMVSLGVTSQGDTANAVQTDSATKINKIIEFVKSLGIKKEDITTQQASINPRYDYRDGANKIVGYESTQIVSVKIRGVDKDASVVGKLMEGATLNGANQVYGSQFAFDDPDNLRQQARELAIKKAKEKATELAKAAGLSLGKVVSVSESSGFSPGPIPYAADAYMGKGGGGISVAPSVETGTQDIVESMTVVFELK